MQYPAETGAYDRELRRRQVLLWKCAVDAGAILLHAAVLRALDGLPRIVTRILQLRAELRAAIDSGDPAVVRRNARRAGAGRRRFGIYTTAAGKPTRRVGVFSERARSIVAIATIFPATAASDQRPNRHNRRSGNIGITAQIRQRECDRSR